MNVNIFSEEFHALKETTKAPTIYQKQVNDCESQPALRDNFHPTVHNLSQ
jgi:hypothetical protein